jgi:hypothetical protein
MRTIALAAVVLLANVDPVATRKTDAFDAPFTISVEEAAKASGRHEAHAAPADAAVVYTCLMHPEVTSTKPGKCPKCGMTLVVRKK